MFPSHLPVPLNTNPVYPSLSTAVRDLANDNVITAVMLTGVMLLEVNSPEPHANAHLSPGGSILCQIPILISPSLCRVVAFPNTRATPNATFTHSAATRNAVQGDDRGRADGAEWIE